MSLDTGAAAAAIVTILEGLAGMGVVQIGAPESVGPRVSAYVSMGSQRVMKKAAGVVGREARIFVQLAYRVDGAETTAETTLMGLVDDLIDALNADVTLGGVVSGSEIDTGMADEPDYQLRAGKEYREYPVVVTVRQYGTYAVNPA